MSDKSYTPANGKSYQVRRGPGGELIVQDGSGHSTSAVISTQQERIDFESKRVLWERASARRLLWVSGNKGKRVLSWPGGSIELDAQELSESTGATAGKLRPLKLTMPGKVLAVKVTEGEIVEAGQGLVIVEAMKMENILLAPARAKIAKIHVKMGDRLESGSLLVTFESA